MADEKISENKEEHQQPMHPSFMRVIREREEIKKKLANIKHKIGVYSAKGGVGKTTVAVNIAYTLSKKGFRVGLLDADIDCPNLSLFLGIEGKMATDSLPLKPLEKHGVKVASTAMLVDDTKKPIIWRGPIIVKMIYDFFQNTDWGNLDYLIIDLPPGCLPAGTFVRMANNYSKPIEKVEAGEFVCSYEGGRLIKNLVTAVLPQGEQEIFKIKTPNRTVFASANHPFLKYCWDKKYAWRTVSRLEVGDRLLVANCITTGTPLLLPSFEDSKYNTGTQIKIPKYTDNKFMQIIGHFVGDGYIRINKSRNKIIGIRVCEPKEGKFRKKYETLYKEVFDCNIYDDGETFAIASLPMVRLFDYLGLNHPALEKIVPEWVFSLPLEQRQAFICGYSEADGHIRRREVSKSLPAWNGQIRLIRIVQNCVGMATTNERLARQMHELCQISGLRSTNVRSRVRKGTYIGQREIRSSINYEFEYSQKPDYAPFKLARIKSIEPAGRMETYDLQLDGSPHSFIANNMIVHNTSDAPLTIMQVLDLDGFIIVTTPQRIASINSIRSGLMAKRLSKAVLGVIENMSDNSVEEGRGGKYVAESLDTRFLGTVPFDREYSSLSDMGKVPVLEKPEIFRLFDVIVGKLVGK